MILLVGLGNPGEKYQKTRHNIGFQVVDEFAQKNNFPNFSFSSTYQAELTKGVIANQEITLVKPQTFMNLSGKTIKVLFKKNTPLPSKKTKSVWISDQPIKLLLIHDDLDLLLGKIKIIKNRGTAGHKGVESIINELKTKNFIRFRIGIKNKEANLPTNKAKNFVLKKFNDQEKEILKQVVKKTVEAIETTLKEGLEKAMNQYNQ